MHVVHGSSLKSTLCHKVDSTLWHKVKGGWPPVHRTGVTHGSWTLGEEDGELDFASAGAAVLILVGPPGGLFRAHPIACHFQEMSVWSARQAGAISTAARARILAAFTAGHGYAADADYSPTSWLIHRTKITKGAARGHAGWAGRVIAHPQVVAALAEGTVLSESMARIICGWTDKLPAGCRPAADEILVAAARAGARKEDLAALAAEIYARSPPRRRRRLRTGLRGPAAPSGDHVSGCGRHLRGPHPAAPRW
jgi:hypothetical protein